MNDTFESFSPTDQPTPVVPAAESSPADQPTPAVPAAESSPAVNPAPIVNPVPTADPEPVVEIDLEPDFEIDIEPMEQGSAMPDAAAADKKKKGLAPVWVILLCLFCALIGGAIGGGTVLLTNTHSPSQQAPSAGNESHIFEGDRQTTTLDIHKIDTSKLMTAAEVYATNVNSTVGITTSITTNYWGHTTTSAASGSGFILSDDGYILTNHHVIENSSSILVRLYNGESHRAKLIGYDASNDIAVLKIEATGLTPVILGDSDNINVGDDVVAIGNPLGELTFSLTKGAVSALNREVTMESGITMNLIQTDCAINSGNSGGALFNMYGEVIGITNAKYSSGSSETSIDNIGFAIPLNDVRKIIESILEKGYISKAYLGVSVLDVSEDTQSYGLPAGAAIKEIQPNSPAQKAGLQLNDIVIAANGTTIRSAQDLVSFVARCNVGDKLTLKVYRRGATIELEVVLEEKIQSSTGNTQPQQPTEPEEDFEYDIPGWNWDFDFPFDY